MFQLIAFIDPAPVAHVSFTLPIVFPVSALFLQKNIRESQPVHEDCSLPKDWRF